MKRLTLLLFIPLAQISLLVSAELDPGSATVESLLSKHDFKWDNMPVSRETGAFIGNGMIGASLWAGTGETLRWELGRNDIYTTGEKVESRTLIGKLILKLKGSVSRSTQHQSLNLAEVVSQIQTDKGSVACKSIIPYEKMVGLVEFTITGNESVSIDFSQLPCISPGMLRTTIKDAGGKHPVRDFSDPSYLPVIDELKKKPNIFRHPASERGSTGGVEWVLQPYTDGGGFVVAWGVKPLENGRSLLAYTLEPAQTGIPTPAASVARIRQAFKTGFDAQLQMHRAWWKTYYAKSFVSIPDELIEGYYWRQIYKLGAATRPDGVVLDELGPWPGASAWVRVWNNLNIQIAYLCPLTANRMELCTPFIELFNNNHENLAAAVPEKWQANGALALGRTQDIYGHTSWSHEFGNLAWALQDYWLYCRYTADDALLKEKLYPLLKGSAQFMINALEKGADGFYHLPHDTSPEYPGEKVADPHYSLSLLLWNLKTLEFINQTFSLQAPEASRWRDVLENLTPLPIDETGLMVGSDRPFAKGHRHYSHLLAFFPLRVMNPESPEGKALFRKSYDHWNSFWPTGRNFFSCSGAAAMAAWLRDGEAAAEQLHVGIEDKLTPNTHFSGAGVAIESALSGMWSVGEMLLQSWTFDPADYRIRVFPAIPESWKDVRFDNLRAEGAFLVSAEKKDGIVQRVKIFSEAGKPCRLENPFTNGFKLSESHNHKTTLKRLPSGAELIEIDLKRGETVVLTRK